MRLIEWLFFFIALGVSYAHGDEVKGGHPQLTITFAQQTLPDLDVTDIRYKLDGEDGSLGMAIGCKKFINPDGTLGEWGLELEKAMDRVGQDCFRNTADFSVLCPNYGFFGRAKQRQFLTFFFAAKAFQESSCNPDVVSDGVYGKAVGLFQLEDDNKLRESSDRDKTFCSPGVPTAAKEIKFQMECAAATFREGYCTVPNKEGLQPSGRNGLRLIGGSGVDNNYYWKELNTYSSTEGPPLIVQRVRRFPGCMPE